MFYVFGENDEDLRCSFCKRQFVDVVKLITSCGESICGDCYEALAARCYESQSGEFDCRACCGRHVMPADGLPDCKSLSRMLKRRKIEKPMSSQARTLKSLVGAIRAQLRELGSFDESEHVNYHCDMLEVEVVEEIESLVKHLNEIGQDLIAQIAEYRERCLNSLSRRQPDAAVAAADGELGVEIKRELEALTEQIGSFDRRWSEFFERADAEASDAEIAAATVEARSFETRMNALNQKLKVQALSGQTMVFSTNHSFFGEHSALRSMLSLPIETRSKNLRIQPTPTRTLTGHDDGISQVVFLPNNQLASSSLDHSIKVWSLEDGSELFELEGHKDWVYALVLLPNGWLASGSEDASIRIWNLEQRKAVRTLHGHAGPVVALRTLSNGNMVSYSNDNTLRVWSPYSTKRNLITTVVGHGNPKWLIPFGVLANDNILTCSLDASKTQECVLRVWNHRNGRIVKSVATGEVSVWSLLVLANGQIALGFENGWIMIVDLDQNPKKSLRMKAHDQDVFALAQLSNGNLVSCGTDYKSEEDEGIDEDNGDDDEKEEGKTENRVIKVWDLSGGPNLLQTVPTGHSDQVSSMSLRPNDESMLVTASFDETIKLWRIASN